jgi:iron complex transport system substrate-binding protein
MLAGILPIDLRWGGGARRRRATEGQWHRNTPPPPSLRLGGPPPHRKSMGRIIVNAALWVGGMTIGGCAEPVEHTPSDLPTVVSLNPCTDAVLARIAAPGQVKAISHYSHDPRGTSMELAEARRFRATGGTVEEVLALDPDLVVASTFIHPATRAALEDLGVRVETFGIAASVEDSLAQVEQLGMAIGREEQGRALSREIAAGVKAASVAAPTVSTVLWQPGGIVPGEGALVSDLLRRAGLASHSAARGLGQADFLPLEQVVADPPELLLVAGDSAAQRHPVLTRVEGMRVARFDPALLYCGGPTLPRAMARLAELRK